MTENCKVSSVGTWTTPKAIEQGIDTLGKDCFRGLFFGEELAGDGVTTHKWTVEFILKGGIVRTEPCFTPDVAFRVAIQAKKEEA